MNTETIYISEEQRHECQEALDTAFLIRKQRQALAAAAAEAQPPPSPAPAEPAAETPQVPQATDKDNFKMIF